MPLSYIFYPIHYGESGGSENVAKKIYYLNKIMHGLDVHYEIELPEVFQFTHLGTILGRAKYSNYLIFSQGGTIGGSVDFKYPSIGEGVDFFAGSAVIGDSHIGDNRLISIGTVVRDTSTPNDTLAYNESNKALFKPFTWSIVDKFFKKGD